MAVSHDSMAGLGYSLGSGCNQVLSYQQRLAQAPSKLPFVISRKLTGAFVLLSATMQGAHLSNRLLLSSRLNGNNIVPNPVTTTASGVAGFMFNATKDTLEFNFSATGLSGHINGLHIHQGDAADEGTPGMTVDLSSLKAGLYLLRLETDKGVVVNERLVKN